MLPPQHADLIGQVGRDTNFKPNLATQAPWPWCKDLEHSQSYSRLDFDYNEMLEPKQERGH